jgi:hypothetical protein
LTRLPTNLVLDTTFETGVGGWIGEGAVLERVHSIAKAGSASLSVRVAPNAAPDAAFGALHQIYVPRQSAGLSYEMSAWVFVRADSPLVGRPMAVRFGEQSGPSPDIFYDSSSMRLRAGWQRLTRRMTIVKNGRVVIDVEPFVTTSPSNAVFYLDQVTCRKIGHRA